MPHIGALSVATGPRRSSFCNINRRLSLEEFGNQLALLILLASNFRICWMCTDLKSCSRLNKFEVKMGQLSFDLAE